MPELTIGAAIDGLKKMGLAFGSEPKFKRHLHEQKELAAMAGEPLLIMVMGEFSSGKSTFINAILGQEVTVRGATPTTAVITKICYGDRDEAIVHFKDGRIKQYDPSNFMRLTAEPAADDEARRLREGMDYVEKRLNLSILKDVSIIDSPGLGAITSGHEQTTKRFMGNADVVVWLMSAQQPAKASEVHVLESLDPRLKPIVLVNQIDLIDEEEDDLEDILHDVRQKVQGHARSVHGISALKALEGGLTDNKAEIDASNIGEFFDLLRNEVLPHRDEYRMHTLVHETATLLRHGGATLKFWSEQIEPIREFNYENYANEQATLQSCEQTLAEFARLWKEYVYDKGQESERQYFEGVLYQYGLLAPVDNEKALECFKAAARYGEADAETAYAAALEGVASYHEAFAEYKKAALKENGEAAAGCARLVEQGRGEGNAQEWYRKAARWGFMEAHLHINYGNDVVARFNGLREAAIQGIPEAQVALAECYRQGIGCVRDVKDVFKWQLEAALQGLKSQFLPVAQAYREGIGVEKDVVREFYWLTRAADYGDAECALNVALCFFSGYGVQKDRVESFVRLSKLSNNSQAERELEKLFVKGTPEDQILIGDAALNGNLQELLGDRSIFEAVRWYERAESKGSLDASYRKGLCLWRIYQEKNHNLNTLYDVYIAVKKAAQAGHVEAKEFLQKKFESGTPELQYKLAQIVQDNGADAEDVFYWCLKSANGGYAPAFTAVGEFYASGIGCEKNWSLARTWLSKARREDGEIGKESYKVFMAPIYRRIKIAAAAVVVMFFTLGVYMGYDYLLAQPNIYKMMHGDQIKTELSLGMLELGDDIDKMYEILGEETSRRQNGDFEFYIYPSMEVVFRNGRIEALVSKDDSVATKQGIRSTMPYKNVVDTYGKPTFLIESDGLELYEYKFDGFDNRYGLLRFAVDPSTQLVEYISVRIPIEETERVQREAERQRLIEERIEKERKDKEAKEKAERESRDRRQRDNATSSMPSDLGLGGICIGYDKAEVYRLIGKENEITNPDRSGNLRYQYPDMEVVVTNGVVSAFVSKNSSVQTKRGIHQGSTIQDVRKAYGNDYLESTYDGMTLVEYKMTSLDNRECLLRFAIKNDRVEYISARKI